jgi:hypothetical protein
MKLRGQRILLVLPQVPDMKVIVDEKLKQEIAQEYYAKADKLEVFMVGELVEDLKTGDKVYVPVRELQQASLVEIDNKKYAMINVLSIALIW